MLIFNWINRRFPLSKLWNEHLARYYVPKNLNFWYIFGVLALVILVSQIVTGIWLTMNYSPNADKAFASVEYIMRDVPFGWLLRYMHSSGASCFFLIIYLHMFRGLLYGSYKEPRELVWIIGMLIFLCLMAEAFFGYLLPWGNMSLWGAQVITSLFGAIPVIGDFLMEFIRGDYNVSGVTLNRFFALHVVAVPLIFLGLVALHIIALHHVGSGNPDGIEIEKTDKDNTVPFHPYYTMKDLFAIGVFLFIFSVIVFFFPDGGGYFLEPPNFYPADMLQTPEHIAPVWYMTPYYAILRAIPNKLIGVIAMLLSIGVFFFLPWLDRSPVKSIRYRSKYFKLALLLFVLSFITLGYLGMQQPTNIKTILAQVCTVIYFGFFGLMPIYSKFDDISMVPSRLSS